MADWWMKAEYIECCNCAHGCACNLTALPTDGTCDGLNIYQITEGAFGDVHLDGLGIGSVARWPNPIHEGNGKGMIYIDELANPAQREALRKIGTGDAGSGGPFEVFASTYIEPPKVVFGPCHFEINGKQARVKLGDMVNIEIGPIKSVFDGAEADAHMVLPGGFIFQDAVMVNTELCEVDADGISIKFENSNAFLSNIAYNV